MGLYPVGNVSNEKHNQIIYMTKIDKIAAKGTQVTFLTDSDLASDQVTDLGTSQLPEREGQPPMWSRQLFLTGQTEDGDEVGTIVYLISPNKDVPVTSVPIRLNKKGNWVGFIA